MPQDETTDRGHDGELVEVDTGRSLRFVRRFDATRDEVWDALTDPDRMARWAFRGTLEPRVGGSVVFDLGDHGEARGTVIAWDEPSMLEYRWGEGETTWHVRFDLAADPDGSTTLTFDHLLPDATQPEFAAGWHWHLDRLDTLMGGAEPADVEEDEHFHALLAHYRGD